MQRHKPFRHSSSDKLIRLHRKYDLSISYGLAPNPFGFTFEPVGNKYIDSNISDLLKDVEFSKIETQKLKKYLYDHV